MGHRWGFGLLFVLVLFAAAFGAGWYGYNMGLVQGVAERAVAAAPGAAPVAPVVFYPRPWGFGFGFFPFAPLFFILFWILILRGLFWRGRWGRGYGYGCGYGGVPPAFDEWHRRAHEQRPPASPPTSV
jgi:hypothetical protein